jgi:hypothetical protein
MPKRHEPLKSRVQCAVITPAIKYNTNCHSDESRNPGVHWMPDQVRHDGSALLNCRVNIIYIAPLS